ncbi:MAG: hypothetical protein EAZ37_02690 [Burkholderiales bacterium]|nr:MAG: hypothetical protein EAZ37_02690 [Burkholderiales bacterium]
MFWRTQNGTEYLIRSSVTGLQKSLGAKTAELQTVYERFTERKAELQERVKSLKAAVQQDQRLNRALRVGRTPKDVIAVLQALALAGLSKHFLTVGTNAVYAYESAAGVRVQADATATRDMDLLFDTRQRLQFATQLQRLDSSFLAVLRKADKSYRVRTGQRYTVVNQKGYEVDVIRRMAKDGDPHPMALSEHEDEIWPVQVGSGEALIAGRRFDALVIGTDGSMARMHVPHPLDFVRLKKKLSKSASRDPLKKSKDGLQSEIVAQLITEYLPQLSLN